MSTKIHNIDILASDYGIDSLVEILNNQNSIIKNEYNTILNTSPSLLSIIKKIVRL